MCHKPKNTINKIVKFYNLNKVDNRITRFTEALAKKIREKLS